MGCTITGPAAATAHTADLRAAIIQLLGHLKAVLGRVEQQLQEVVAGLQLVVPQTLVQSEEHHEVSKGINRALKRRYRDRFANGRSSSSCELMILCSLNTQ